MAFTIRNASYGLRNVKTLNADWIYKEIKEYGYECSYRTRKRNLFLKILHFPVNWLIVQTVNIGIIQVHLLMFVIVPIRLVILLIQ